jgi:hypothetical protein
MKAYHTFLTSALLGGEWLTSRTGSFTPGTPWIEGPQSRSGRQWRSENSWSYRDDSSVTQQVASRYTDCTNPALQTVQSDPYIKIYVFIWKISLNRFNRVYNCDHQTDEGEVSSKHAKAIMFSPHLPNSGSIIRNQRHVTQLLRTDARKPFCMQAPLHLHDRRTGM